MSFVAQKSGSACPRKLAFVMYFAHRMWLPVAFRIIWRNVSELFGIVSALRRNASQTVTAKNMAAIHKQNQRFTPIVGATLGSREGTLVLPRRSSGLSGTPNSSQTLRQIAIKATASGPQGSRAPSLTFRDLDGAATARFSARLTHSRCLQVKCSIFGRESTS
jgi:hypothetical protein